MFKGGIIFHFLKKNFLGTEKHMGTRAHEQTHIFLKAQVSKNS